MSLARFSRLPARFSARQFSVLSPRMADKTPLDADKGGVGKEFKADGAVGGAAQKVGGPFDKDGAVGSKFKEDGPIGGKAQEMAENTGDKSVFDKDGAVGREFQADGKIGSLGEKVGGPFSKDGAIGKQFTDKGAVGGTVQENVSNKK